MNLIKSLLFVLNVYLTYYHFFFFINNHLWTNQGCVSKVFFVDLNKYKQVIKPLTIIDQLCIRYYYG